jgi:hypothetical protein
LVSVLNEQHLTRIEIVQKLPGFRYAVATEGKVRNPLLLLGDVSLTCRNVSLGFLEMADLHRATSKLWAGSPSYAGRSAMGLGQRNGTLGALKGLVCRVCATPAGEVGPLI